MVSFREKFGDGGKQSFQLESHTSFTRFSGVLEIRRQEDFDDFRDWGQSVTDRASPVRTSTQLASTWATSAVLEKKLFQVIYVLKTGALGRGADAAEVHVGG